MNYTEYLVPQDYGVILNNATLLTATQTPVRFMFYYCDDTKEISLVNDKVAGISSWEYDPNYRPNTFGEYTHVKVKFLMHVYVNGNWDVELKDVYLYKIGTSFPEPYFVPNGQTVQKTVITGIDVPSNQMKYYMGMGIQFHPDSMMNRLRSECRSRIDNSAIAEGIEKYQKRLDSAYVVATTSVIGQALDPSNFADNLSCTYDIQDIAYTLYYYDQAGNLIQTVPPQGFDQNPTNGVTQHHLKTQYKYNSLNQLVWQRTPDGGTTEYFYDKAGQLRFSQNSKQRACSTYSYTRYDNLGRVVETGKCNNLAYVLPFIDELTTDSYGRMVSQYPESGMSEVTRIFYDNAPAFKPAGITTPSNTRSRIVASAFYNSYTTDGAYDHAAWYSYDAHGNVKTLWQDFHLQAPGIKQINYEYDLVSGKVNKVLYQPGSADQFIHRYEYDADNRITRVYTSRDGRIWEQDAKYYYYLHGPLARVELGHDKVQGLDYAYTLQGWIKGVNSNTLLPSRDIGKDGNTGTNINKYISRDAFGFSLGYYSGDYATTGSVAQSDLFLADNSSLHALTYGNLYNGNISNMLTSYTDLSGVVQPQAYKYAYDQLNRIRSMAAYQVSSASNSVGSTSGYASSYTYDLNGNLLTQTNNSTSAQFDNLQYKYDRLYTEGPMNYNRLTEVNDQSANSIGGIDMPGGVTGFTYDSIGNIVSETATNYSTNISWTNSNKVKTVSGSRSGYNFTLGFAYDASGERITKHTYNQQTGSDVTTYYVRDATGNILATYTLESATLKLESYCMYGSSRLGELKLNKAVSQMSLGALTGRTPGSKRYELTNHLGNVVATLSDDRKGTDNNSDGKADYYEPILVSASDFYPFGMQMPGRIISSENYRYGFNGKEKDDELNGAGADYDFGARIYDARLGRFLSTDWYSAIFPSETPFSFGGNNPVYFIDYNGDYRVSQAFKDAYPVITKYLETNAFDDITNSPTIIRSMIKNTDLGKGGITLQQITDMATWGHLESPTLDGYSTDNTRGEYDPTNNVIKISSNFLKSIEEVLSSTTSTEEDKLAALYLFYYILIHESTHYAEWKANPDLEQIRDAGINTGHCGERVEEECFGEYNVPIKWNDKGYPIEYAERFPIDDFPTFKAGIRRATRIINFKKENKKRDDVIPTPVGKKRRRYEPSNPY